MKSRMLYHIYGHLAIVVQIYYEDDEPLGWTAKFAKVPQPPDAEILTHEQCDQILANGKPVSEFAARTIFAFLDQFAYLRDVPYIEASETEDIDGEESHEPDPS